MRASIVGAGRAQWRIDSAAVLDAGAAKGLAQQALARRWARRDRLTLRLAPERMMLQPGAMATVTGRAGLWRVDAVTVEGLVTIAELSRTARGEGAPLADPGRATIEPDRPIGATVLALFDLPDLGVAQDGRVRLHAAVSCEGAFRPVPLHASINGQASVTASAARRAVLGSALTVPGVGPVSLLDGVSAFEVALVEPSQLLLNADEDALAMGANLAVLGNELLQFGRAEALGEGRYRLSRLLRGRRGTEWAMGDHVAGEAFVLLDAAVLVAIELEAAMRGAEVVVTAHGVAEDEALPPSATRQLLGGTIEPASATAPPTSPVDGSCYRIGAGATGEWFGRDGDIAAHGAAGWRFVSPYEGLVLTERDSGVEWAFRSGEWVRGIAEVAEVRAAGVKVVGAQQAAIASPGGGSVIDAEARGAVGAILAALRGHGLIAS